MTPKQRLLNTLRGKPTDRIPLHALIPFALNGQGFKPGPFHGYRDHDDWREKDPAYRRLVKRLETDCDNFFVWQPACMQTRRIVVRSDVPRSLPTRQEGNKVFSTTEIELNGRTLKEVSAVQPGTGHSWMLEHFCADLDDARRLLDLPWDPPNEADEDFHQLEARLGDRGVFWVTIPSPLMVVCRLFDPTHFLLLVATDKPVIHELLEIVSERIRISLQALLDEGVGPVIRIGGPEHATPPLMSPANFDEFVVRYDTPLVRMCKEQDRFVAVHCHGRIRHALARFVEMGIDQVDPVEQEPDGDLTLSEAREIAQGKITLTGNIQVRELTGESPDYIRERVRQVIEQAGPDRLILSTTGTPLEAIPENVERNYHALIDAALEKV